MLSIYIDFKSPSAYLAFKPTLELIDTYKLSTRWLPFPVKQSAIAKKHENETKGETHRRVRAEQRQQMHKMYAALSNTNMHFPEQPGNSDLALTVLANLSVDPVSYIARVFSAYWIEGQDINDVAVIEQILEESNIDFTSDLLLADSLNKDIDEAKEKGIYDVPVYILAEQLFLGRENMPWLRELAAKPA